MYTSSVIYISKIAVCVIHRQILDMNDKIIGEYNLHKIHIMSKCTSYKLQKGKYRSDLTR